MENKNEELRQEERSFAYELLVEMKCLVRRLWWALIIALLVILLQFGIFTYERMKLESANIVQESDGVMIVARRDVYYGMKME